MNILSKTALAVTLACASLALSAANSPQAFIPRDANGNALLLTAVSDNGKWALAIKSGNLDNDNPQSAGGVLYNLDSKSSVEIKPGRLGIAAVSDVTDDGEIVAGAVDGLPAYWIKSSSSWTKLPVPAGYDFGELRYITPDGKRAVGYVGKTADWEDVRPVVYDISTNTSISLTNLPFFGMNHATYRENAPFGLTPDGKKFIGMVAPSILADYEQGDSPFVMWAYVYDIDNNTYKPIGFELSGNNNFTPLLLNSTFINSIYLSPSGQWATGSLRVAAPIPGSQFADDYTIGFRYNLASDKFETFNAQADRDITGLAVDNNGTVYGAAPWDNIYASAVVRNGNYYYTFDQIFSQVYDFSLISAIGNDGDITGRPLALSGNGLLMTLQNGENTGYTLVLNESLGAVCSQVDLLARYSINPPSGSTMSSLKSVQVTFDRAIDFRGDYQSIRVIDENNNQILSALSSTQVLSSNENVLNIGLRTTTLEEGKTYTLVIPAGTVNIKGDSQILNKEIRAIYHGRGDGPVNAVKIYPEDNASVSRIDASTNPIILTFDSEINVSDLVATLYEGDYRQPKALLYPQAINSKTVYLAPLSSQYLFKGTDYRIEIPEGLVTDFSGAGASEAITLNYSGNFVREVITDETVIFRGDGSTQAFLQFITFDGDQNEPTPTPQEWGFTSATPWWGVLSSAADTDFAFASHSMYSPAGKSDDWMMTPQLFIPDAKTSLSFDLQGYKLNKQDRLKVYVFASEEGINSLNQQIADEIRSRADLVYDEIASPGATEENLTDEWTNVSFSLAPYAGKSIYIAFVNENENQSALFLDNIVVSRDLDFTLSLTTPANVVARTEIPVAGALNVLSETKTFSNLALTLLDADEKPVSEFKLNDVNLANGDVVEFTFPDPLPLEVGALNRFSISVELDGEKSLISDAVASLAFEPVKRVILEEYSGASCKNCPLGIVAIENLEKLYPYNFIPVMLRGFGGDILGAGVQDYISFLGLQAAPSGLVDRFPTVLSPMVSVDNSYFMWGEGIVESDGSQCYLWADAVRDRINEGSLADIDFSVKFDADSRNFSIPVEVRYALNTEDVDLRLFTVVLEDNVPAPQSNGFAGIDEPSLLPWSLGGSLAQSTVLYNFNDVARTSFGNTFIGTGGLLPSALSAGDIYSASLDGFIPETVVDSKLKDVKIVVMLIDGRDGRVINANVAPLGGHTSIEALDFAEPENLPSIVLEGNRILSNADRLLVYSVDGALIASGSDNSLTAIDLQGLNGVVIVRAVNADGKSAVAKFIIR